MSANNKLAVTTPSDTEIVMTRAFDAPRELIWEMWTNPKHLPQWMTGPEGWSMPICEIDLRIGGTWRCVWRKSDDEQMEIYGVYKEITPPGRLVNTENWGGEFPETLVTMTLTEENGKTTMMCLTEYPSKESRDAALKTGMEAGAADSFDHLAEYLTTLA